MDQTPTQSASVSVASRRCLDESGRRVPGRTVCWRNGMRRMIPQRIRATLRLLWKKQAV